mmetsp:Transcript_20171/g.38390  ORF Transcript_20171/g.38390 Transcript_20171/m.38390 type:complete len:359 (+) Transcript_20171:234-1310(+)
MAVVQPLRVKLAVAGILMVVSSAQPILATLSKVDGQYPYNFSTIPLLSELCKLMTSTLLLLSKLLTFKGRRDSDMNLVSGVLDVSRVRITPSWSTTLRFMVPSLIYLVINNISFAALEYMTPSTWQILNNLKILTAGIASRIFLNRKLTELQWLGLVFLLLGVTTSQISAGAGGTVLITPLIGYLMVLCGAVLAAMAAVYTEFILKSNEDSLDWQQMQLYMCGSLLNIISLTVQDYRNGYDRGAWPMVLFQGYNMAALACVLNMSFAGVLTSWVFKFADTIMKVFASSMAMLLTTIVSIVCFDQPPTLQLFLGITISTLAVRLYYYAPEPLDAVPSAAQSRSSSSKAKPPRIPSTDSD